MQYQTMTYTANIYCGLRRGYGPEGKLHTVEEVLDSIQEWCDEGNDGVTVTPTIFVYEGGREPGVIVGLANYPRNPRSAAQIEERAKRIARFLREEFGQERVSIVFPDHSLMIGEM
jgi:hypothetical protein